MEGWYIGPTLEHYCCVKIYLPKTHSTVIANTVKFIPTQIPFPYSNDARYLKQTVGDLLQLLQNTNKMNIPKVMFGDEVQNAMEEIADILKHNNKTIKINNKNRIHPKKFDDKKKRRKFLNKNKILAKNWGLRVKKQNWVVQKQGWAKPTSQYQNYRQWNHF